MSVTAGQQIPEPLLAAQPDRPGRHISLRGRGLRVLGQQPVTPQLEKHYVYTTPSRKAIQKVKDKVKAKTYRRYCRFRG